jgi:hypothetical protein
MPRAYKKPVAIDYFPIEQTENLNSLVKWAEGFGDKFQDHFYIDGDLGLRVKTLEGTSYALTRDDVVIRGVRGEYYPCKKDIFEQTYSQEEKSGPLYAA